MQKDSQPLFNEGFPFSQRPSVPGNPAGPIPQAFVQKEASFLAFLRHTPNLAWIVDEYGTLQFGSAAFFKHFSLESSEAVGKNVSEILPPVVSKLMFEKHQEVLINNAPTEFVQKAKWADGTRFMFHINIFPIESNTAMRLLGGCALDLSDKFSFEKELKETHERLLHLSRATSDAIWEWDMQTGRIFRNEVLMDMIGYQPIDSKGLSWWLRRIHPEDRNRVSDNIKDITDKGLQVWEEEYRFKCADGGYKHMHDKGFIVYENGLPVKMIGSLQDISHLKELEGKLVAEKLERQQQLSEMAIRVQEKERTRIGHELHDNVNQILSTVKLFIDMIRPSDKDSKEIKEKASAYVVTAIEEIRKLSRELVVPQLKSQSLVDSIRTIIDDINIARIMDIRFTHDQENDLVSHGKKLTIFRIVQEQLKNILKYSQAKKVHIFLQKKQAELQLVIKDDGVGFDTRKATNGMGFSNIHDRVQFYNGRVELESSPGKGCTLTVTLPIPD